MQNSRCQLIYGIIIVILLTPLFLVGAISILPTFDDWTSLVSPSFEPFFSKERFLFFGYHWRPFDSIFGYIVGLNPQTLFPLLNHICVVLGHVCSTILLFILARKLQLSKLACNLATLFFFLSPGMLATVLAVDGLNQTYANVWALIATLSYLSMSGWKKYVVWLFFIFIATLCKENALMWALIAPIIAYVFDFTNRTTFRKDLLIGIGLIIAYFLAILLFPSNIDIHPEYVPSIGKTFKDFFKFLLSTWFAVDFVSLLHQPSRNLIIAIATLLLSLPLVYFIFIKNFKSFSDKRLIGLVICLLIAVAPHIFTVFSMMHTYAGLAIAALIIGVVITKLNHSKTQKLIYLPFIAYFISAVFVDVHLWHESYKSGLVGKQMAQQAIEKTLQATAAPNSVEIIIIEDDYPRLSSFCVIPSDAFGWGRAVQHETNYQWPTQLNDTTIERNNQSKETALKLAQQTINEKKADCVWIVDKKEIEVVK